MKRVRMEQPELKTWDDVNEALRLIAEAQNEQQILEVGGSLKVEDAFWYETKQVDLKVG